MAEENPVSASVGYGVVVALAEDIAAISKQAQRKVPQNPRNIECVLTGTGAISATVLLYGSNTDRNDNGTLLGTMTLNGTDETVDSVQVEVPWPYMWTDTTAISGTDASHNVTAGV